MPLNSPDYPAFLAESGSFNLASGNYHKADSLLTLAVATLTNAGKGKTMAFFNAKCQLADCRYYSGHFEEAERTYRECLDGYKAAGLPVKGRLGAIQTGLGNCAYSQGRYSSALKWLHEARSTLVQFIEPTHPAIVGSRLTTAKILRIEGRLAEATDQLTQLKNELEKAGKSGSADFAEATFALGEIQDALGDYETALALTQEALPILEAKLGAQNKSTIEAKQTLSQLLIRLDRKPEAFARLKAQLDSLPGDSDSNPLEWANTFSLLADCDPTEGISWDERAIAIFQKISGQMNGGNHVGAVQPIVRKYWAAGRPADAKAALAWFDDLDAQVSARNHEFLLVLADRARLAVLEKKPDAALLLFQKLLATHQKNVAEEIFLMSDFKRIERTKSLSNLTAQAMTFASDFEPFASVALDFQLFTKSLLLSATQKIRQNIESDSVLAPVFSDWTDARERLAWAYTQPKADLETQKISIPALETRADSLEKIIARSRADFAAASLRGPFGWQDVRAKLRPGEAALEIARFHEYRIEKTDTVRYAIFIITPAMRDKPAVVFLPNGERIEQILTEKYLAECAAPGGKGATTDLYEAVWEPLEPFLKDANRVFVSADGAFHKINLAALRRLDGRFLAEKIDIRPVFSLRDIGQQTPNLTQNRTALLVGNPAFSTQNEQGTDVASRSRSLTETDSLPLLRALSELRGLHLEPLPGSQKEVEELSSLLQRNGWQTTLVTGENASETAVKSVQNPKLVHLATHGYFLSNERSGTAGLSRGVVQRNPMLRSMLFFAGAQNTLDRKSGPTPDGDDGVLTAFEAQNLDLAGTELVVLSACQTALGKLQNGEGVYGLQRALRIAGAQNLLLSLWDVDDAVGREFMRIFYEKWLGGADKAAAFRAAQLAIKAKYPQPFYWAGFVLIGG